MPPKGSKKGIPFIPPEPSFALPALPPAPLPPLVERMRRNWRWAHISQFCTLWLQAIGGPEWDPEAFENDMDNTEEEYLPFVMVKLLYAMTLNRNINSTNWLDNLRRQYLKRMPDETKLGTPEEPIEWAELGLGDKIKAIYDLCEWQMIDSMRFRSFTSNGDGDAEAAWRVEPIGRDKEQNIYWLFDDYRLWVQHPNPNPKPITPRKLKPPVLPTPVVRSRRKKAASPTSSSPISEPPLSEVNSDPDSDFDPEDVPRMLPSRSSRPALKRTRTYELQAGIGEASSSAASTPRTSKRSRRSLREEQDVWQEIPQAWLTSDGERREKESPFRGTGLAEDDEEGSELSDLEESARGSIKEEPEGVGKLEENEKEGEGDVTMADQAALPPKREPEVETKVIESVQDAKMESKEEPISSVDVKEPAEGAAPNLEPNGAVQNTLDQHASKPDSSAVEPSANVLDPFAEKVEVDEALEEKRDGSAELPKRDRVREAKEAVVDWPEWETVCVSRYDWENFPLRFAESEDVNEKKLFELLTTETAPIVIDYLKDTEKENESKKKAKEIADANVKRSSRLSSLHASAGPLLSDDSLSPLTGRSTRARRSEPQKTLVELEREAKEKQRKEREERLALREESVREAKEREEYERLEEVRKADAAERKKEAAEEKKREAKRKREEKKAMANGGVAATPKAAAGGKAKAAGGGSSAAKRKGKGKGKAKLKKASIEDEDEEDWTLNCEICGVTALNPETEAELISCDRCNEWQHIACHDNIDARNGRSKRDWEKVEFKCQGCRRAEERTGRPHPPSVPQAQTTASGHPFMYAHPQPSNQQQQHQQPSYASSRSPYQQQQQPPPPPPQAAAWQYPSILGNGGSVHPSTNGGFSAMFANQQARPQSTQPQPSAPYQLPVSQQQPLPFPNPQPSSYQPPSSYTQQLQPPPFPNQLAPSSNSQQQQPYLSTSRQSQPQHFSSSSPNPLPNSTSPNPDLAALLQFAGQAPAAPLNGSTSFGSRGQ